MLLFPTDSTGGNILYFLVKKFLVTTLIQMQKL